MPAKRDMQASLNKTTDNYLISNSLHHLPRMILVRLELTSFLLYDQYKVLINKCKDPQYEEQSPTFNTTPFRIIDYLSSKINKKNKIFCPLNPYSPDLQLCGGKLNYLYIMPSIHFLLRKITPHSLALIYMSDNKLFIRQCF